MRRKITQNIYRVISGSIFIKTVTFRNSELNTELQYWVNQVHPTYNNSVRVTAVLYQVNGQKPPDKSPPPTSATLAHNPGQSPPICFRLLWGRRDFPPSLPLSFPALLPLAFSLPPLPSYLSFPCHVTPSSPNTVDCINSTN